MSNDQTSTVAESQVPVAQSQEPSQANEAMDKAATKNLLSEARKTRDMLVGFRAAIESGSYNGNKMFDLARGLAFLEAILNQNNAHIHSLQDKLNG